MNDLSTKESGKENPYTILLHHLTGLSVLKPRKAQAFSLWAKANSDKVLKAWDEQLKSKPVTPGERTAKLNTFKSKLFKKELMEVQMEWAATADEEHKEAMKEYNKKMDTPVSKEPEDMQRCQESLSSVVQPFIEMIGEVTGCVVTCIIGGPQPADGGHLHVSSYVNFFAYTLGTVKQNFVQAERVNYQKYLVPMFGNFLKRCFMIETCRAHALALDAVTLESIGFASEEQGIAHHVVEGYVYNEAGEHVEATAGSDESPMAAKASTSAVLLIPAPGRVSPSPLAAPLPPSKGPSKAPTVGPPAPALSSGEPTAPLPSHQGPPDTPSRAPSHALTPPMLPIPGPSSNAIEETASNAVRGEDPHKSDVGHSKRKAREGGESAHPKKQAKTKVNQPSMARPRINNMNKTMMTNIRVPAMELPKNASKWAVAAIATF
ncbi:uncharacterized protein ARMOST_22495 [Armillaria ostoyae]|uniref:Uncharacterized protein n=1 Tax=Armillaria ostoyae TaxID=47428 RepID=A0A284SD29_ARMOS|nr:uncharacterized protein ARMOST_22495 [Armillaria ostoyae]